MTKCHWSQVSSSTMEGLISVSKSNIFSEVLLWMTFFFTSRLILGYFGGPKISEEKNHEESHSHP